MGHLYLGRLPHTYHWKHVIALVVDGADLPELASASLRAALTGLKQVPSDPGFIATINSIVELASAAREQNVPESFWKAGISIQDQGSAFGLISAISEKLTNQLSQTRHRSDVGKIAQDAFLSSLSTHLTSKAGTLFGPETGDITRFTEPFRGVQFKTLMHEFYAGFTSRYLTYYLSRELPKHVGGGQRFANMDSHAEFGRTFDLYCRQAIRIADEFTPGWIGKAVWEGRTDHESVRRYAHFAFKKIASEFQKGGD